MKYIIVIIVSVFWCKSIQAQMDNGVLSGKISYISSQNIYVKFKSTQGINTGDTLFVLQNNKLNPALVVTNLSSTSCICVSIINADFTGLQQIIAKTRVAVNVPQKTTIENKEAFKGKEENIILTGDTLLTRNKKTEKPNNTIRGSISVSSYSYISNVHSLNSNRYQYNFSLDARNIASSQISFESNISFRHQDNKWNLVRDNIYQALKIYNLSLKYDISKKNEVCIGRRINPKLSSVGAIDGIQFETRSNHLSLGMILGSRPDYIDYGFNFNLPQVGAYISHDLKNNSGVMQNSFAFIQQMNSMKTDRRFIYFQHTNSLVKNLYLYNSVEVDLYQKINDKPENVFKLSSIYTSFSYRMFYKLILSASYDNRKNVIYYETYKSFINKILETEARQGLSFQVSYNTRKCLSFGLRSGYRFKNSNAGDSRNLNGFISFFNIPVVKTSAIISATYLESDYLTGKIFNLNINRDLFKGKLYTDFGYQFVNYQFTGNLVTLNQNIVNVSTSWNMIKNLTLSVNFEETFEGKNQSSRLNLQLRKRF